MLIKVNAVALNYRDQEVIAGNMGEFNWPVTLASDMSDAVVGAGRSIAQFAVGNRVISTFFPEWRDGRPIIDARYGLSNLPQALEHLNRGAFGKIVIGLSL
ncbi:MULTISPECIES: alcohol dehydrogenase catalytic domain-containing protein [Rhizobiaceae]|uniref:alcohol dehydrogenase catalytic domain-containing protein n=1 Tax=Rhizobium sp. SG570 TaxID=2587113 RepID=UPI001448091B|nr:NADPH:quinone reductase-like Zn-dependent oxidoreductase [Rhizobium sp. SG570]